MVSKDLTVAGLMTSYQYLFLQLAQKLSADIQHLIPMFSLENSF